MLPRSPFWISFWIFKYLGSARSWNMPAKTSLGFFLCAAIKRSASALWAEIGFSTITCKPCFNAAIPSVVCW